MADPFRLRVLKALAAELKQITPTNTRPDGEPFAHDLTDFVDGDGVTRERVARGRTWFGPSDPLPLVSILEAPEPEQQDVASRGATHSAGEYHLIVQGFVADDPQHPTDPAHVLAAEVISVLAAARTRRLAGHGRAGDILGFGSRAPCVGDIRVSRNAVVRPPDLQPDGSGVSDTAYFYLPIVLDLYEDVLNPFGA